MMLVSNEFESQVVIVTCSSSSATYENQMSRYIMPIKSQVLSGLYPLSVYSVVLNGVMPSEIAIAVPQVSPGVPTSVHEEASAAFVRNNEMSRVRGTNLLSLNMNKNTNKIRCKIRLLHVVADEVLESAVEIPC